MSDCENEDVDSGKDVTDRAPISTFDSDFDELDIPDSNAVSKIADITLPENNDKLNTETEDDKNTSILNKGTKKTEDNLEAERVIPFNVIHSPAVKSKSLHRNIFIPGLPIKVQIIHNERSVTTHLLNPNLYTIQFTHGDYKWVVKKRYKHIQHLHQQLRLFRTSLNIPFPTKTHRERRTSFKNSQDAPNKGALPRFPSKPDALVPFEQVENRIKQLEEYLSNLLNIPLYRNHEETIKFVEVSQLSFIRELGLKGKEGMVRKRTGSTQPGQAGCDCFGCCHLYCVRCNHLCQEFMCAKWRTRWLFVKESCFGYINPKDGQIRTVCLFDQGFEISSGMYSAGMRNGMQIMTLSRQLYFKCWTKRKSQEWMQHIKEIASNDARDFTQPNPNNSFVPARTNIKASWFVDGSGYMSAVADAIEAAKEEIYITDWWLSPEIYLKRRIINYEDYRLDRLLQKKAQQGVKVFVLLYKEVEMALGINSFYSKSRLTDGAGDNIKVLRHPDHAKAGVFLWAHHEKMVVVDQSFAFVGGIDLCYGRWDDAKHRLTDLGSVSLANNSNTVKKKTSSTPSDTSFYSPKGLPIHPAPIPEFDFTVSPDPNEPSQENKADEEKHELPVLQPGDSLLITTPLIPERMKCNTPEFERKTTFDKFKDNVKTKGKDIIHLIYNPNEPDDEYQQMCPADEKQKLQNTTVSIDELDGSAKLWIGKDYTNFIVKDFANLESPYIDLVDRNTTPRMPWHDIGVFVEGKAARDVARHFIQRWNACKLEKARVNATYPYLVPKSYNIPFPQMNLNDLQTYTVTCQVLRSASCWSVGFLDPEAFEQSIHEAYIDTIRRAQHYIYIENQFFVTLSTNSNVVYNQIGDALFERITRAHRENCVFRVYVVMPLLPGFEGEIGGPTGTAIHAVTHWNYASICRGKYAILNRLKEYGIEDPSIYINFYGLRTHSQLHNEPITELVYVHSKLMIVDDKIVICGSANINDRSLLGKRDSEIAVIIQDEEYEEGIMNGKSFPCGKYAGSLRKHLFKEHLGILGKENETYIDISDPTSNIFYKDTWHRIASDNTEFYEKVFHCIPSDKVDTFAAYKKTQEEPPLYHTEVSRATVMLDSIEGHLVLLPLNFLSGENLTPSGSSVEGMMPTSLWT